MVVAPQSLEKVAIATAEGLTNGTMKKNAPIPMPRLLVARLIGDTPTGRYLL